MIGDISLLIIFHIDTTRTPTSGEENNLDYNFVSRASFEKSIAAAEFIEHGHYNGHYYGTSFSAVRKVIASGKTCVLNMHCQVGVQLFLW